MTELSGAFVVDPGELYESGTCWLWRSHPMNEFGYVPIWRGGRVVMGHRWVFEQLVHRVRRADTLDHLCRNRACCNPDHLEVVPFRINVLRGYGPTAMNARKKTCDYGHEFVQQGNRRRCLECKRRTAREWKRRHDRAVRGSR